MSDIDYGYYDDIIDEGESEKVLESQYNVEEEVEVPRTDADADAAETLASFPKDTPSKKKITTKKRKSARDNSDTAEPKKKRTTSKTTRRKKKDLDDETASIGETRSRKKREKVDLPTLPDGSIDLSRATMRDIIRAHDKYGKPTKAQAERERALERRKKKGTGEEEEEEQKENEDNAEENYMNEEEIVVQRPKIVQEEEEEEIIVRGNQEEEEEEAVQEEEENTENSESAANNSNLYAPQIRMDANGQIIIDEESMVVHQDVEEARYDPEVVFESTQYINANSFSKRTRTERWSKEETAKFYRVIQQYGSDFTLIAKLFPNRTRNQIRNKFKKEEKENSKKIDHALRNRIAPDLDEIRNAVKVAVEKEAQERKEKGIVDEPDYEAAPEVEVRPIVEEDEENNEVEEPSVIEETQEEAAEEVEEASERVLEDSIIEEEEVKPVAAKPKETTTAYDYFGNYDEDEEVVGTLE